jgi:hypothetical protein
MARSGGQYLQLPQAASRWAAQSWRQGAFVAVLAGVLAIPAQAQRTPGPPALSTQPGAPGDSSAAPGLSSPSGFSPLPSGGFSQPSIIPAVLDPAYGSGMFLTESCNTWTEAGFHSPTVSATRLMVPGKASGEYQKACGALKDKKLDAAEQHVRKALDVYPNYAAAWVLLGQILAREEKRVDARAACSQAMHVDASYVPPYICLADFAVRDGDWDQVSVLADRAQALDPVNDPFTFYFTASVELHFKQIHQAEANAEKALSLDLWHHMPELHYLMAQIDEAKGDLHDEAIHLREYLKQAPNSADSAMAKTSLAQIQAVPQK